MYSDDPLVQELLSQLKHYGVRHVVISPGSRHYPITRSLESDSYFTLHSVVDERSAGFFALGIIQATGEPAATLCTSGTASINYGSSVVEAYYQKLPLVALTPDRLPELLGQMEDQMFPQTEMFREFTRFVALLKPITGELDRWYNNRVLNEALTALTANGGGPVQINVPIQNPAQMGFTTTRLPETRRVVHHSVKDADLDWEGVARRLEGRRVMVLWGQSPRPTDSLAKRFAAFAQRFDVVTLADHLSNLADPSRIRLPMVYLRMALAHAGHLRPDIVVTLGGNIVFQDDANKLLRGSESEHWRVSQDGEISDPFQRLTDVFEMRPEQFFTGVVAAASQRELTRARSYAQDAAALLAKAPTPDDTYGEMAAIGRVLRRLPPGSVLHVANSAPIRMSQLFDLDSSIDVLANRGINGIDGCMSTAIGYASLSTRENYLLIGDLAFFYDMNSLWIRDRPSNLQVIVFNNEGGALMHASWGSAPQVGRHVSAAHRTSARGWAESVGLRYRAAATSEELDSALDALFATRSASDGAMLLEVMTEKTSDIIQMKAFFASLYALPEGQPRRSRLKLRVRAWLETLGLLPALKRVAGRG